MGRDTEMKGQVYFRNMEQNKESGKDKKANKTKTSLGWIVQGHTRDSEEFDLCQRAVKWSNFCFRKLSLVATWSVNFCGHRDQLSDCCN